MKDDAIGDKVVISLEHLSLYQLASLFVSFKRVFLEEQAEAVRAEAERRVRDEGADFVAQLARVAGGA